MTVYEYDAHAWAERLADAIYKVASVQRLYRDELEQRRQHRAAGDRKMAEWSPWEHPTHELSSFYQYASSEGSYRPYQPLREALERAKRELETHPVLAGMVELSPSSRERWISITSGGGTFELSGIVAGLVARGGESGVGHRAAVGELQALLDADVDRPGTWPAEDLSVGYHVALFYGLRLTEEIAVDDDLWIVPFESVESYLAQGQLRGVALKGAPEINWPLVGAIVTPFRWKPEFRRSGDGYERDLDWGGSFFEDADDLMQLLAVFHASPVVCLLKVDYCIHQAGRRLLGLTHYHHGYTEGKSARGFDMRTGVRLVDREAVDRALVAFGRRRGQRYRDYAPAVSRLAEALARSGQFRLDDQILDVAIALERMYDLSQGEISFKLKTRAACFLAADTPGRRDVFDDVNNFYEARSSIVHKGRKQKSAQEMVEAFNAGFDVARRTIERLLRDGQPKDWNDVVIAGADTSPS